MEVTKEQVIAWVGEAPEDFQAQVDEKLKIRAAHVADMLKRFREKNGITVKVKTR